MVLTEEQLQKFDDEIKQRGMGINPANTFQDEADSYSYTPEATMPEQELPQQYAAPAEQTTEDDLYTSDAYITGPTKINPNPAALKVVEFTDRVADNIKKTNIYKRATYTKDDVLREAKEINIETGIPINSILYNAETLDNARNIYNYRRKQMELMMPGENEVSMDSLMKAYPGLDNIINSGNEVDAAIALQNIKNVRQMTGIVEIAKGNWNIGLLERKMGQTGVKAFREGRAVTEEEFAKYDAIQKQIQEFKETPGFFEDPMMSIVGGTARQIPQQLTGAGTGTLYGGVLAGLAAGATVLAAPATGGASLAAVPAAAKTGFSWGMRAGYAVDMFENSAGQRYIEYSRFKDENGKRMLTDEEARAYAAVAAAVETGIEFMNAGKILDVLQGNKSAAAKQIREVVAGATDNATFVAGLKRMLSGAVDVAVSESLEEGAQEGADRLISTGVSLYKGTTAIPRYTPGQMLEGALENTLEALPATIGFGLSAAGGGSIGLVQRAARLAEIGNFRYNEEMKNVTGVGMVKTMSENTEVKEFFKKDPEVAKQVLKNTVAGTGYEKVNIDTEMVARQENGLAALRDIGERAGMSVEEIQTAIETGADLTVPTEVYFQMRAENENFAINDDFIAFSDVAPSYARNKYYAEMKKAEIDAIMNDANTRQLEQQMAAIDMIVQDNFAEGIERDAAAAVLTMRPDNPLEGLKEMRGMYKEQLDSILAPVIRDLEKGMKQGVDVIRIEGGKDGREDVYNKVSNNADWARAFYKENKRWPTKFELEGMAIDILSGRDFSKLADYQNKPEMQEYYEANAAQIDELLGNIEAFDNIEERIANIDADELQTMEGMSREAYDIYKRESANAIANAPNDAVKRAAKMGAALLAYRADRYAEAKRAAGETNYTAKDYYDRTLQIKYGGTFQQPQKEQYFQVSAEEFNRQKDAVRKQYENTDQWLKAPNGEDTNLTEDQWVTVRTDAFKNWFGDWENDTQNASKALDKNGEPLVVYHGTTQFGFTEVDFDKVDDKISFFASDNIGVAQTYSGTEGTQVVGEDNTEAQDRATEKARQRMVDDANSLYYRIVNYFGPIIDYDSVYETLEKNARDLAEGKIDEEEFDTNIYEYFVEVAADGWEEYNRNMDFAEWQETDDWWEIDGAISDAEATARAYSKALNYDTESGNYALFMDLRNPLIVDAENNIWKKIPFMLDKNVDMGEYVVEASDKPKLVTTRVLSKYAKDNGYDGVIIKNVVDEGDVGERINTPSTVTVAFEPNQIKDATGRNIGFDPESGNIYLQAAYHGTPNRFDRFSTDYMGTGEGAQVHGWGLYFTQDKDVAEGYRSRLLSQRGKYSVSIGDDLYELASKPWENRWMVRQTGELVDLDVSQSEAMKLFANYGGDINKTIDFIKNNLLRTAKSKEEKTYYKSVLNFIQKNKKKLSIPAEYRGQVFEVDIPENDVLLDEQKTFEEQPEKVRAGIQKLLDDYQNSYRYEKVGDEYVVYEGNREVDRYDDKNDAVNAVRENREAIAERLEKRGLSGDELKNAKGRAIYLRLSGLFLEDDVTSKKLNDYGIKGITYFGELDGRCFVVFDDKAISILEKYYQRQQAMNDTIQGATEFRDNGQRVVTVFDSGNESTIAHELGHVFVADLKDLAEMPNAPEQIKKDWQTIKEWLGYKDSQTKFTTAQQEKFARGFEAYLRTGEAPSTGLRKVFQNFKNWLCKIYKDFLSLGGKPSKDVQAVMGRMLATADEVEQTFKLREAESFEKAGGFDYLAKDSLEMYKRWQKDAQEYAKEKVLKEAMKNLTEQRAKELEAVREKMTDDIRTQLLSTPVYRAEMILSANPKLANDWPAEQFSMTYEEYTEAIKTQGTLDEATKKAVDVAMQEVEEGLPLEEIKRDAENAVNTSEYRGMYLAFEQDFIQKKMRRDETLSRQIEQTLADIEREASGIGEEVAEDSAEVKRLKQRIKELKYQARWTEAELKTLNRLERASNKEERMAAIKAVKEMLRNARKNVKVYRDNAVTNYKYIKQYAKENMAQMSVDDATNVAKWTALEKRAGRESVEALKRALDSELRDTKVNNEKVTDAWQKANDAKFRQRVFAEYAALATKNKAKVQRKNARLQARQKTIERNNNIPANERYMYVHGLYVLGLSKTDAQMPQGEPTILGMFQEYSDNLQAFFVDEDGKVNLPDYILSAFSGNMVYNDGYTNLTMEQYDDFVDVLTAIYKAGIDANKVKSMKDANGNTVLISDVCESVIAEMNARVPAIVRDDITNAGSMTFKESIQDKARRARVNLTKPETILEWMGPTAHRYIYETVNQSWNKEKVMQEQVALAVKAIWEPYTNTEKSDMRSKRQFRFGTSILTREEMICVAFNWGTELNRKRIMDGFNVDESTVRELLSNMTQKDWQMVTSVWDLVNSYWPETVRVEESMVGVAPQKQSAMPFEIVGKDGNVYKLNGGYYPIIYDPNKSLAAANQAQEDVAKQMAGGNAAMNRNRGYLKKRTTAKVSRPVMLSFNVLNKHLNSVVHNICFRESLRDVNRIIKNQAVSQAIEDHFGIPQARAFRKWVEDCWAPDIQNKDFASSALEFFRHKQTAAALGYRATTAMLNSLNIFPITHYLGPTRTIDALQKFYNSPKENWNFALDRSVFLRERAETMDRDAGEVLRKEFIGGYGKVADTLIRGERAIEAHAFDMLAVTDLALACPLWLSEYQRVYEQSNKNLAEMDEDAITRLEMEAVAAGDKAVRKIFGSGEMKDLAPIQKGGEMTKAVTMFYSYFNVVFNALYGGYAQGRREAMTEGATKVLGQSLGFRIAPLVNAFLYWTVLTGVFEGLQRNAIDVLVGGSDDPEEWLKKMFKGVSDNIFGTIPVVRDIASMIVDKLMGERYYGAKPLPAYQLVDTAMRFWNTVESKKKTKIDVFREGMRITNGFTGIGNTLTDAMATTAYWVDTDFDKPFLEYLTAVIFDKRIDKKKKK